MSSTLPMSIESYLGEAGFSPTEMLVLRKLVEEDSVTVRELATKTGKSTGVLDQMMKKLVSKKIARKEVINGVPRFVVTSLDSIVRWMHEDMKERREMMERRHQDFASFVASLKHEKRRPEMEFYEGLDGIKQAYRTLLDRGHDFVQYGPTLYAPHDDPLRDFRIQYFRNRHGKGIFSRIITHDTPLGYRFQSRDPFEYRKTILVDPESYPFRFEKIIVGETIACFELEEQKACFIRYPKLAEEERIFFERLWNKKESYARQQASREPVSAPLRVITVRAIPPSTKILSTFRQFFLGKRSVVALVIFAIVSGVLTFGLSKANRDLNLQRLKDKVLSIASTGVLQFDAADINAVWTPDDITKPEYARLIAILNLIRRNNTDIQYAYIMRKTNDPAKMAFVADADSLYPNQRKDLNGDGIIDEKDALSPPGEFYDVAGSPLILQGFDHPITEATQDQWGNFISGYAPIRDKNEQAVAVLGIDMFASNLDRLSVSSFTPLYAFIGFFLLFMLIRFWSENRSLMEVFFQVMKRNMRKTVLWILFIPLLAWAVFYGFSRYKYHLLVDQTGKRLMAIVVTAAEEFDPADLEQLHWAKDMKTEAYQRVFKKLNEIRNKNPDVKYAYIQRPTTINRLYEFVADADSNYNLPLYSKSELVDEKYVPSDLADPADQNAWPGLAYFDAEVNGDFYGRAIIQPTYGVGISQWGYAVSAMAPIYDSNEQLVGFLGLDIGMSEVGK